MTDIKRIGDVVEITETKTTTKTINLKEIQEQINNLQNEINSLPKKKKNADKETLDFWNFYNIDNNEREQLLIQEKQELQSILEEYS